MKAILFIFSVFTVGCAGSPSETVVASAAQNAGKLKAEVIELKGSGLFGETYFLEIMNLQDSTSFRVRHDLLESRGGYESGITGLNWLTDDKLLIGRALDDRPRNLIYSISQVRFEEVGDSLSTLFTKR